MFIKVLHAFKKITMSKCLFKKLSTCYVCKKGRGGGRDCLILVYETRSVCVLVTQSRPTLCDPMDCSLPGSSVYGILQARILEWGAIHFARRSSQPRDWTQVSHIAGRFFTAWATREDETRSLTTTKKIPKMWASIEPHLGESHVGLLIFLSNTVSRQPGTTRCRILCSSAFHMDI